MKQAKDILKWGKIKPFFDSNYKFNSIDIETVDNELFLLGSIIDGKYRHYLDNFYDNFHNILIDSLRKRKDILTWSRYDNTHLLKLLLSKIDPDAINDILLKIGKITPIFSYDFRGFKITIVNIIKDSIIFKFTDRNDTERQVVIYNLKNLFVTDLETTAKNYNLSYYSKIGIEYHIIDKNRFSKELDYHNTVLLSNELDNKVIIDIGYKMLNNFKKIAGVLPKSIYTAGSLARSYLLSKMDVIGSKNLQFKSMFSRSKLKDKLLDASMRSYHGGKIESYALGYIPSANIIDITSAYPYALASLEKLTGKVIKLKNEKEIQNYFYVFIRCDITILDRELIHPLVVPSPINKANVSPYGYIKDITITKIEYDYLIKKGVKIDVLDMIACESIKEYPYSDMINDLFDNRMLNKDSNPSLADLYKTILNSLYGITFELTDVYDMINDKIKWLGFRAGDFFNPVIASYITGITRTYLSDVSHDVIENGGKVFLNMTDSIIYHGIVKLDVFSAKKVLGKFETPQKISDIYILGAGRYEYKDDLKKRYTIKNRGFSVSVKDKGFYNQLDLNNKIVIDHTNFITPFKATQKKYEYRHLGHLIKDTYNIDPFNLGGKRIIENMNVNLNKEYTRTLPIYFDKDLDV